MSDQKAAVPDQDPQQGLKDNEKTLKAKIARLEKMPHSDDPGIDRPAALARAKRQLVEVNKALRKESK